MTERKEHFDDDFDLRIPSKLSADLNNLYKPQLLVPPETDRAIMDRINKHFVRREPTTGGRRRFRWIGLWRIAAAAAVIIFAFSLELTKKREATSNRPAFADFSKAIDIDLNGRVDILDAFKLARHIESSEYTKTNLSLAKQGWDINSDGLVNSNDVDLVALAAVRLDKGVL
ncbi:MAG: dockerin type I domain-containing protein [Planctomycetota bacterium]|jgi:hypothetical protein